LLTDGDDRAGLRALLALDDDEAHLVALPEGLGRAACLI
jgi:hypothetical protein